MIDLSGIELHASRESTFLIGPRAVRDEYNSLRATRPDILAGLSVMTTETMFLIVTRYQLRNTYVDETLLVSTYLCLLKLTPIKGFHKCSLLIMFIASNLQSEPKIFMRASCGPNNLVAGFLQVE